MKSVCSSGQDRSRESTGQTEYAGLAKSVSGSKCQECLQEWTEYIKCLQEQMGVVKNVLQEWGNWSRVSARVCIIGQ